MRELRLNDLHLETWNLKPKKIGQCIKMLFIMAIKVKAVERNVSFDKNSEKWAYVLQADLYNKLSSAKVIQEAALRSGIYNLS